MSEVRSRLLGFRVGHFGWGLADQALSSLTNFALGISVARTLPPAEFGAFGIAFGVYTLGLGLVRALTGEPLMVRFSGTPPEMWGKGVRSATGAAIAVGGVCGAGCLVTAAFVQEPLAPALVALGLSMPGLLLQDTWRFAFFSEHRGGAAFLNDLVWTITLVISFTIVLTAGQTSVSWFLIAWGVAATFAAAVGVVQARVIPQPKATLGWLRRHWDLIPRFASEFGLSTFVTQATMIGVGVVASLAAVGALRAGTLLLGPLTVVFLGVNIAAVPEGIRVLRRGGSSLRRFCSIWSLALLTAALVVGLAVMLLPQELGQILLGDNWTSGRQVILPLTINMAAYGLIAGASIGLRALAAPAWSLRARAVLAPMVPVAVLSGAAAWGAVGAAWGFALVSWIGSLVWWRFFLKALSLHAADGAERDAERAWMPIEPDAGQ